MANSARVALLWLLRGRLDPSLIRATRETVEHIDNIKKSVYFTRHTKFIKDMWKGVKTFFQILLRA